MLTAKHAALAKKNSTRYTDFRNHSIALTSAEQDYFHETVEHVLAITGIEIAVYKCDHELLPGTCSDALGIHWKNSAGDEFITIDNFFIHEAYEVAFNGACDITGETLVSVLCHELAHIRYQRHSKYHAELTARYIKIVEEV